MDILANKKSVIIGNRWHEETESKIGQIDDHVCMGYVCLDAWCWEATDRDNEYNADNSVACDVEHGVWRFEHFYDMECEDEDEDEDEDVCEDQSPIYSKFTLVED